MVYTNTIHKHVCNNIVFIIPLKADTNRFIAHNNISNAIAVKSLLFDETLCYNIKLVRK